MKTKLVFLLPGLAALLWAAQASALEPSLAYGQKLFNDPSLGGSTNSTNCNTCHPGGRGLEQSGNKADLFQINNRCLQGPLGAETLTENSAEMQSLILYLKSLAGN